MAYTRSNGQAYEEWFKAGDIASAGPRPWLAISVAEIFITLYFNTKSIRATSTNEKGRP